MKDPCRRSRAHDLLESLSFCEPSTVAWISLLSVALSQVVFSHFALLLKTTLSLSLVFLLVFLMKAGAEAIERAEKIEEQYLGKRGESIEQCL
jgi:membrane protein implicated in regulation of membrane protease activity